MDDLVKVFMLIFFLWMMVLLIDVAATILLKHNVKQIKNQINNIKGEFKESYHKHKVIDSNLSDIDEYLNALEGRTIKRQQELSEKNDQQQKIINILYQAVLDDGIKELMQEKKAHMEEIEKLDGMLSDFLKGKVEENGKE